MTYSMEEDGSEPIWEDTEPFVDYELDNRYMVRDLQCPRCGYGYNEGVFPKRFEFHYKGRDYVFHHHGNILVPLENPHNIMVPYSGIDPNIGDIVNDLFEDRDIPCTD